jgi:cytochrome c553
MPLPDDRLAQTRSQQGGTLFAKGRQGLAACATCHGVQAQHATLAPWLDAQHGAYLIKQLEDFKHGRRHNYSGAVMRSIAAKLTDEDIEALACYLASTALRQTPN